MEGFTGKEKPIDLILPEKVGYRSWRIEDPVGSKDYPSLVPLTRRTPVWGPGENVSSFKGSDEAFRSSDEGFYSVKELEDVSHYYPSMADIAGSVYPYGKVIEGTKGYRSTKAELGLLYGGGEECQVCGSEPGVYSLPVGKDDPRVIIIGEDCIKKIRKVSSKFSKFGEKAWEKVLQQLGEKYEVGIETPIPEALKSMRRSQYSK